MTFPNSCHFHLEKCVKFYADSLSSPDFIMTPQSLVQPDACRFVYLFHLFMPVISPEISTVISFIGMRLEVCSLHVLWVEEHPWEPFSKLMFIIQDEEEKHKKQVLDNETRQCFQRIGDVYDLLAFSLLSRVFRLKGSKLIYIIIFLLISRVSFSEISHKVCLTTLISEIQQKIYCNTILKLKQEEVTLLCIALCFHF